MDEQSKAALELLVQNGYLEIVKEKYRATAKLNKVEVESLQIQTLVGIATMSWEDLYVKFIQDCTIPKWGESGNGDLYELNKYSADAMKVFRKMIEKDGIKYDLLVKVTIAYYKSGNRFRKKIGNYITEGLWRLDYMTLKDQPLEKQQQTLNNQINDAKPFTRDRIG
jgi:hypothetical protein